MALPATFLDQLRDRVSIGELVGKRVRLVRRGNEFTGLCPFHNEKTPSFTVSEGKGFYHCFGCGAHGSAIDFVMHTEGLNFLEAVERLAGLAGLAMPAFDAQAKARAEQATGIANVVEVAAKWFEAQLKGAAGEGARQYLAKRGLDAQAIARFRLGYAPNARTALKEALAARGVSEALMLEAGLIKQPDGGGASYDRFRDRVIFPITDRRGRAIAFGGRALGSTDLAKYLNSPETPLFHKGNSLYNHALAAVAALEAGTVIVAEGYFDVISLVVAGFPHTVAPLGTALTEQQLTLLWRMAPEPILCFDGDAAGGRAAQRAAERALPLLSPGRSLRFAVLPAGLDPDDLIRQQGEKAMADIVAGALPLAELLWRHHLETHRLDTPERRAALQADLGVLADQIKDPTVKDFYRRDFAERLAGLFPARTSGAGGFSANTWSPKTAGPKPWSKNYGRPTGRPAPQPGSTGALPPLVSRRTELLLAVALRHPAVLERHVERFSALEFGQPLANQLKSEILKQVRLRPGLDVAELMGHLEGVGLGAAALRLAGSDAHYLEPFARPAATLAEAEAGWVDVLGRLEQEARAETLTRVGADLGADLGRAQTPTTEQSGGDQSKFLLAQLKTLKEQEHLALDEAAERSSDS
jgi:DNA primase